MGKALRLASPILTLHNILEVKGRSDIRLTTSPFGVTPEQYERSPPIYVGKAVHWKGAKGEDDVYQKALFYGKASADALVKGIRKAKAISKAYAGVTGTILYQGKLYPAKCIAQKNWKTDHPNLK